MSPLDLGVWGDLAAAVRLKTYADLYNKTLQSMMYAKICQQGYGPTMITGSSRPFLRYPTTHVWISSRLPVTED